LPTFITCIRLFRSPQESDLNFARNRQPLSNLGITPFVPFTIISGCYRDIAITGLTYLSRKWSDD